MKKAHEIMTSALVTCKPDVSVAQVARLMRDRDTGDVLIAEDGKLMGIVTDRDIAVRMAAEEKDPREVPVSDLMSTHLVTGQATWDLNKIADTMSKHQIRRLPILENGMLVGIVSLGDLALSDEKQARVGKSLKEISEPSEVHLLHSTRRGLFWATLGVGLATAAVILSRLPARLTRFWEQMQGERTGGQLRRDQKSRFRMTD